MTIHCKNHDEQNTNQLWQTSLIRKGFSFSDFINKLNKLNKIVNFGIWDHMILYIILKNQVNMYKKGKGIIYIYIY